MGKRSFEEVTVVSTGVQHHEDRFGKRQRSGEYGDDPPVAHWRCNLTALSQKQNLYFVAYCEHIYVYVPQYPTQALPQDPALIVPSTPSSSGLAGTIDPDLPHSINHLVVQHLGNEEVVAAVRDDGDVNVFLVRHIVHAMERRAQASIGHVADEIKPIFHSNVGQSAWGLAVHSQARIIAVSANTHNITIFKFGLAQEASSEDEAEQAPRGREDVTHSVINGSSNIPCIALCNTGDDPKGRWLLTTDIGGNCRAVDLEAMQTNQTFRFSPVSSFLDSYDRLNSGWGVMFLSKRSFIPEDRVQCALGMERGDRLPGMQSNPAIWDIGGTASHVTDCATKFGTRTAEQRRSERRSTSIRSPNSTSNSARQPSTSPAPSGRDVTTPEHNVEALDVDNVDSDRELDDESDGSGESSYMVDLDFEDGAAEALTQFDRLYGGRRIYGDAPRAAFPQRSICDDLPCPIMHTSVRNVYLLQPPARRKSTDGPFTAPTVGFTNALHQLVQGGHHWLNAFERLNMQCYIPAIGVVVLASQKGRVMVLSLTRVAKGAQYPIEMKVDNIDKKSNYAMRIEHILPFAHQEELMHRPFQPLHGIATSPIQQGIELLPEDQRRWRLMLMYADHSILSYEISRRHSRDAAVDLGSVVV